MGLTAAFRSRFCAHAKAAVAAGPDARVIALAGNPNVGKSTVFNALTGLKQHTGNWPGKTVGSAQGRCRHAGQECLLVDIPGAYSLSVQSAEEEVARDYLCFGKPDAVIVVCDATCLTRGLHLVFQTLEITRRVVVCVNLMDEAKKKRISIDLPALEAGLGVPCVGVSARSRVGLSALMDAAVRVAGGDRDSAPAPAYAPVQEAAVAMVEAPLAPRVSGVVNARFAALRLLMGDESFLSALTARLGSSPLSDPAVQQALAAARAALSGGAGTPGAVRETPPSGAEAPGAVHETFSAALYARAGTLCRLVVQFGKPEYRAGALRADRILTGRLTGVPVMLLVLALALYLTLVGANVPSALLSKALFSLQDLLFALLTRVGLPAFLRDALVLGVWRTLAWVVAVMLPPMAIFFPLFTLLEDLGYLPRVAFNLDRRFCRCCACGKQALTMCVGDKRMRRRGGGAALECAEYDSGKDSRRAGGNAAA